MAVWTIAGETGKAWNATAQTLEFRAVEAGTLAFRSLEADTLTLQVVPSNFKTYTMPELGQIVRLYRNGTLFFTGHVTDTPVSVTAGAQSITIVVSGPWWWMERINYTSTQTDGTGAIGTRMTGIFGNAPSGVNLQTAMQTAINQCVALGVPIAGTSGGSSVASYFQIPRITLNQGTCAFVITELARLVPDTMVYFDYSTTTPTIQITRRGVATTRTIALTSTNSLNVKPMFEMQVTRVELPYVERDTNGLTKYNTQTSGTAATGKVQIITVSGPELDTFLPSDYFDSATLTGFPLSTRFKEFIVSSSAFTTAVANGLYPADISIQQGQKQYLGYGTSKNSSTGSFSGTRSVQYTQGGVTAVDDQGQTAGLGSILILSDNMPEWAIAAHSLVPITITGQWIYEWKDQRFSLGNGYVSNDGKPSWLDSLGGTEKDRFWDGDFHYILVGGTYNVQGYTTSSASLPHLYGNTRTGTTSGTLILATGASAVDDFYNGMKIAYLQNPGSDPINDRWYVATITDYVGATRAASYVISTGPATVTNRAYRILGAKVYAPADYSFIAPPANLASNLLAAQNFIPYEGDIMLTEQTAGTTRYRGCKVNVSGSLSAHSSMAALVSSETLDLKTGETVIELGTPPRVDYRTFVDRIRKTAQDNIVFND